MTATEQHMLLGMYVGNGVGAKPFAWREPDTAIDTFIDFDAQVQAAQAAERGRFDFLFVPDSAAVQGDLEESPLLMTLEPLLTMAAIARGTQRIGMVPTSSTTYNDPYTLARMLKTLDVMSHGRMGWNVVPSSGEAPAANYGRRPPGRAEKYERLHEMVQVIQGLWGSWQPNALVGDKASGRFADPSSIRPIGMQGRHVGALGPLAIPPSEQGQPVLFQAGGGQMGLQVAGRYATGAIRVAFSIEEARAERELLRAAAADAGRDPDEIKFIAGLVPVLGDSVRDALRTRLDLGRDFYAQQVGYLGKLFGLSLGGGDLDLAFTPEQLRVARPSSVDSRSRVALQVARQGWTVREVLAHGVIDNHPNVVGPVDVIVDHMQEWFEAGAVDGFWLGFDLANRDIDPFVQKVIPELQRRGLYKLDYRGATLREHLGAPPQYGLDPRLR